MNRREMLGTTLAGGLAAIKGMPAVAAGAADPPSAGADDPPELAKAVDAGVRYFQDRCRDQAPLVRRLERAIVRRDLAGAKRAYIAARPPYEEIETLAASFEESDRDIDARPYVFDRGETDEDFRGFHKIEALLFGYEDVEAAHPYATRLARSVARLQRELSQRERFSAAGQFDGMITLANEVAAKKISSEEETWSDQSLIIFKHNWIGVYSQFRPFRAVLGESSRATKRVDEAHEQAMALVRPHFDGDGAAPTPYSRVGVAERRKIADASNRLRDALIEARGALAT